MPKVILVDETDREVGTEEKLKAHVDGKMHRAFSIFVFNTRGELLLQRRAAGKYHSGGLWTNTCCSHPKPGEAVIDAAHRRLKEEMGFDCPLRKIFSFTYHVKFDSKFSEHEYDHVLIGEFDGQPKINLDEVEEYCWVKPEQLLTMTTENPEEYSYWLLQCYKEVFKQLKCPE